MRSLSGALTIPPKDGAGESVTVFPTLTDDVRFSWQYEGWIYRFYVILLAPFYILLMAVVTIVVLAMMGIGLLKVTIFARA